MRGKSLGILGPESPLRKSVATVLAQWWMEPVILLLILVNTVTLIIQSGKSVYSDPRPRYYFGDISDYILLVIFSIYTLEIVARIIVSGFIINRRHSMPLPLSSLHRVNRLIPRRQRS